MSAFRQQKSSGYPDVDLLPPDRARRRMDRAAAFSFSDDVVDAQFVVLQDKARPAMHPQMAGRKPSVAAAPSRGSAFSSAGTIVSSGYGRRLFAWGEARLQQLSDLAFAIVVALAFLSIFSLVGQLTFSDMGGGDAAENALDLTHVNLTPQDRNGMRVLTVNAIVENRSADHVEVPMIRADLMMGGQIVASTYISPPTDRLEAGQSRGLTARLQHPGGKTPELRLSFEPRAASRS